MPKEPEKSQLCQDAEVYYPDLLLCESCVHSPTGLYLQKLYFRNLRPKGSVRAVSGGLPSLGKRR